MKLAAALRGGKKEKILRAGRVILLDQPGKVCPSKKEEPVPPH